MKDKRWDFIHWLISFFSTCVAFQIMSYSSVRWETEWYVESQERCPAWAPLQQDLMSMKMAIATCHLSPLVWKPLSFPCWCSVFVYWAVTLPKTKVASAASKLCSISELLGKTVLQPSFPSNLHFCMKIKSVFKDSLEDQFRVQFWWN